MRSAVVALKRIGQRAAAYQTAPRSAHAGLWQSCRQDSRRAVAFASSSRGLCSSTTDEETVNIVQRALAGGGMEDHPQVSAALQDVRLVIAEGTEPVSGLAVAQFQRANSVIQLMGGTESGRNEAKVLYEKALETEGKVADLSKDALAAKTHAGLCSLCQAMNDFDQALEHAQRAVDIDRGLC